MTRAALTLFALVAAFLLGRSSRVEPSAPAPCKAHEWHYYDGNEHEGFESICSRCGAVQENEDADAYVPMAAWAPPSWTTTEPRFSWATGTTVTSITTNRAEELRRN